MRRYVMTDAARAGYGSETAVVNALEAQGFDLSRQFTRFRPGVDDRTIFEQAEVPDDALMVSLRALVGVMHDKLCGAYGSDDGYEGQYENEVQVVAEAIRRAIREARS